MHRRRRPGWGGPAHPGAWRCLPRRRRGAPPAGCGRCPESRPQRGSWLLRPPAGGPSAEPWGHRGAALRGGCPRRLARGPCQENPSGLDSAPGRRRPTSRWTRTAFRQLQAGDLLGRMGQRDGGQAPRVPLVPPPGVGAAVSGEGCRRRRARVCNGLCPVRRGAGHLAPPAERACPRPHKGGKVTCVTGPPPAPCRRDSGLQGAQVRDGAIAPATRALQGSLAVTGVFRGPRDTFKIV